MLLEVIGDSISFLKNKKRIIFPTYYDTIDNKSYFVVKEAVDDEFHVSTLNLFYVDLETCTVSNFNQIAGKLISLKSWRDHNKTSNMDTKVIEFYELFTEGSSVKFSPKDLESNLPPILEFRSKLFTYEKQYVLPDDFEIDNLAMLINNETFTNAEGYINSGWLDYFIKKYDISIYELHHIMELAIMQEDYNAVKILIGHRYIISALELEKAREEVKHFKTFHGKVDLDEFYDPKYSRIEDIYQLLLKGYESNKIKDTNGYSNLRSENSKTSTIIQKIPSGEHIEVLDNTGEWWLIKTTGGNKGYVYKTKIVEEGY